MTNLCETTLYKNATPPIPKENYPTEVQVPDMVFNMLDANELVNLGKSINKLGGKGSLT